MKIILKYILNNIRERKLRTLVMMLSVVLSTALLFVSLCMGDSYAAAQKKMARGMAGSATLAVSLNPDVHGNPQWISPDAVSCLSSISHSVGLLESLGMYKENGYYENFNIIAADLTQLYQINKPRLLDGSELKDFQGNQIVLPDRFASKFGVKKGDKFTIWIGNQSYDFQVVAIAAYDTIFLRQTRGVNALVPIETLASIMGADKSYSRLLIEPQKGITTETLQAELQNTLPKQFNVSRIVNEKQVEADAMQKSIPFFLISFFSLTMSVFIVFSSYKVITLERLPVIGTFRSIGSNQKTVTRILLLESLVYGASGALAGILVGFGALWLMLGRLSASLPDGIDIPMVVTPLNILAACLVTTVVSVLSALLPIKRASRLPLKDLIFEKTEEAQISRTKLAAASTVLLILSIVLPRIVKQGNIALFVGGLSILCLLVATIICLPMFSACITRAVEWLMRMFGRNESRLAARNLRGNKNITQNITLLFISISAVITIQVVTAFALSYIGGVFKGAKADGFADGNMSKEFVQQIRNLNGIDETLPIYVLQDAVQCNGIQLKRFEGTDNLKSFSEMLAMHFSDGTKCDAVLAGFDAGRNALLSEDVMKKMGIKVGDVVHFSGNGQQFDYIALASYKMRTDNMEALIPAKYMESDFGATNYGVMAYTAPDPDAIMVQIRGLFGNRTNWSRTIDEFNKDAAGTLNAFFAPMKNLTWFILLLATIGIINNLLINHIQRQRAIAMYKSVGMSNRQHVKITLFESLFSALIGSTFGVVVSWLEINTIFLVAGPRIAVQPDLDIGFFLLAGALGIAVTLIGSIAPMIKGNKMSVVEAIKCE